MMTVNLSREQIRKNLPTMQAYAEGKAIQYRSMGGVWKDLLENDPPIWASNLEYRVKPEPREFYVALNRDKSGSVHPSFSEAIIKARRAVQIGCHEPEIIKIREVVE